MAEQEKLLELPEQPPKPGVEAEPAGECKLRLVNRDQLTMAQVDVEHLIDEHHPARGIWEVTKGLDLSKYESAIRTRKGEVGRAAWPPQLLVAVWLYGYSQGITSARELERQTEYEPGLMWLTGMEVINHHSLSDFRIDHGEALTDLFTQMLVVLSDAGLVKLHLVAHDGTKIRAQAGVDSFRREATLREKLAQARPAMPAHIVESTQMTFAIAHQQNAFAEHLEYQMIARIGQFLFTANRHPLAAEYVLLFGAEYLRAAIPAGGQSGFQLRGVHSGKSRV